MQQEKNSFIAINNIVSIYHQQQKQKNTCTIFQYLLHSPTRTMPQNIYLSSTPTQNNPENIPSKFTVQLPVELKSGEFKYKFSLDNISFVNNFTILKEEKEENLLLLESESNNILNPKELQSYRIPCNGYTSIFSIVTCMNECIKSTKHSANISISFNSENNKVFIKITKNVKLYISAKLSRLLGLYSVFLLRNTKIVLHNNTFIGRPVSNSLFEHDSFFVHCTAVEPSICDNSFKPILRHLPFNTSQRDYLFYTLSSEYVNVLPHNIKSIGISLHALNGEDIVILEGRCVIKLSYKKV